MMKLELKHLAPYLPYELGVYAKDCYPLVEFTMHSVGGTGKIGIREVINSELYKPILRPMSDVKFAFQKLVDGMPFGPDYKSGLFFEEKKISKNTDLFIIKSTVCNELVLNKREPLTCPYLAIAILIENHFDVFGLIEKGLAIDINMIES